MTSRVFVSVFLSAVGLLPAARAGEQRFESGPAQVALLELYTSEGCSSCPPAEAWLGKLTQSPTLWRDVVPVAYHVSYWDSLGWKDPFASKEFTQRQYAQAAAWKSSQVYTPCFVRNGAEWRPGENVNARKNAGLLSVNWRDGEAHVTFVPATAGQRWEVSVAVLGSELVSHVKAGENAGRTLQHEFVVERLVTRPLESQPENVFAASVSVPSSTTPPSKRHALAVWVQRPGSLAPVQATGGWID